MQGIFASHLVIDEYGLLLWFLTWSLAVAAILRLYMTIQLLKPIVAAVFPGLNHCSFARCLIYHFHDLDLPDCWS